MKSSARILLTILVGCLIFAMVPPTYAYHPVIFNQNLKWDPYNAWNGYKVFLSAPRHIDSGNRGECLSVGYEENINGRRFGWYGAMGWYYWEKYDDHSAHRNLRGRGYKVYLSKNVRDGGFAANRTNSENWGSDVHIPIHTNAQKGGCPGTTNYILTMYRPDKNRSLWLAEVLRKKLNPVVPDGYSPEDPRTDLHELYTAAPHVAYLELAFHTKRSSQRWIADESNKSGWRIGWAIDYRLGYPA